MPYSLGGPQGVPAAAAPVTLGHRRHKSAGLVVLPQDGYANGNRKTNEFSSVGCLDANCSDPQGSQFCGDLTSVKVGASVRSLTSKRQAAQKLEPLRGCNVIPLEIPLVTGEAFATRNSRNIDLCFKNISYSVPTGILRRGIRHILSGVSGEMRAGELTAILGPSGAGKSTLMDILAGYLTSWTGSILTNGDERDLRLFRRQACYIMQDDQLQPLLTVQEAMNTSANLKLGSNYSHKEKQKRTKQILEALGLYNSRKTRTGSLSGGQKKRLAIALELVSNPPVMFFDEPTSGLDSSTSKHCIALLRKLASEGRTVICTIHQPSALLLEMFDHMYALADGKCVYQGSVVNLVPYLRDLGFLCPPYHNPADFFLEISTGALEVENVRENCKKNIDTLSQKCENGQSNDWRKKRIETSQINSMMRIENLMSNGLMTPIRSPIFPMSPCVSINNHNHRLSSLPKKPSRHSLSINPGAICQDGDTYPTSFLTQVIVLMSRNIRIMTRDRVLTYMRFLIHLSIAITVGILYFQIGKDAHFMQNNFNFLFFAIMFLMFTAFNSMMLTFPLELPIITREHFNRWYSLKAYYMALTLADAPIQFLCTLVFAVITYLMTGQPLEFFRLWYYAFMLIMVSFVGQSIGVFNGAIFDVQTGVIFGPLFMLPFTIFSGFFVHLHDAHYSLRWLFHISYLKYGLEGTMLSIFGYNREKMMCDSEYCHYRYPQKFLDSVDMEDANYSYSVFFLGALYLAIRFMIYFVLSYRLKHRRA